MQPVERWRYRCPRGHSGWECTGGQFWCSQCHATDGDGAFTRLHDRKTDAYLTAAEWRRTDH